MKQCKDIPDRPILEWLSAQKNVATWFNYEGQPLWLPLPVWLAMPDGKDLPGPLVIAKMQSLIKRGLVDGCSCGCRGDYKITPKGRQFLLDNP